jgi:ATP-dependent DNA helicase 2 subunit 2
MPPKKKRPIATVIVIDVGKGMDGRAGPGEEQTFLEQALDGVGHLVQEKVLKFFFFFFLLPFLRWILHAGPSKNEYVSVVLFGTAETKNNLGDQGYTHVYVLEELHPVSVKVLKSLATVSPGEHDGDCKKKRKTSLLAPIFFSLVIDALIVAALVFDDDPELEHAEKKMFILTGAHSQSSRLSDLKSVQESFAERNIHVNLLGANFWESEEEPDNRVVPLAKKKNEEALRAFVNDVKGRYQPLPEGCRLLSAFRTKAVAQRPTYTGSLTLGDISVPVRMFLQAKANPVPSMKKLSAYSQLLQQQDAIEGGVVGGGGGGAMTRAERNDDEDGSMESKVDLSARMEVKLERDYVGVIEPDKHFDRSQLVRAYRFGRTLVPFSKPELEALKYKVTLFVILFALVGLLM